MQSNGFHALTLVEKIREYDQVYTFLFEPETPVSYLPGQYVHLLAPNSPPGRENVRHLSLASVPGEAHLRFTVDLSSDTPYKQKLAALSPGGKAHLFKVKGTFVLGDPLPQRVVFLAGGLGITPVRSLIAQIVGERLPVDWRLAHAARGPHLYEAELAQLGGLQERVRRDDIVPLLDAWTAEVPGAFWYVSGSHRFVEGMAAELDRRGVGPAHRLTEDFE